jgi:hypothetical protein
MLLKSGSQRAPRLHDKGNCLVEACAAEGRYSFSRFEVTRPKELTDGDNESSSGLCSRRSGGPSA